MENGKTIKLKKEEVELLYKLLTKEYNKSADQALRSILWKVARANCK